MKPSTINNPCQHLSIAHSKVGEVMICPDCGVVHVALQSISMRFDLEAFTELATMLARAKATIEQARRSPSIRSDGLPDAENFPSENLMQDSLTSEHFNLNHPHKVH
jgi:hypothetical protein